MGILIDMISKTYDKIYKLILIIPAVMLLFSLGYLWNFQNVNGDIIYKDVSLTGGTTISVFDNSADIKTIERDLKLEFPDMLIRGISDFETGGQKGFFIETKADSDKIKTALEKELGYKLNNENSSIEFSGSTLSQGFYQQLRFAILLAFIFMACAVFLIFGKSNQLKSVSLMLTGLSFAILLPEVSIAKAFTLIFLIIGLIFSFKQIKNYNLLPFSVFVASLVVLFAFPNQILIIPVSIALLLIYFFNSVPSIAVILSAFADIIMTIVVADLLGFQLSIAGVIAFLMLIGYSVDTDILLTTRILKETEGSINSRILGALKTGLTMTLTSIVSVGAALMIIYNLSDTLRQIFSILLIGLFFDIFNTWLTNASILKWYVERGEKK